MANWKELGEVPDSEDEGFDSQDSNSGLTPVTAKPSAPSTASDAAREPITGQETKTSEADDIWNIPDSPPSRTAWLPTLTTPKAPEPPASPSHTAANLPESSPLSPAKSDLDLPSIEILLKQRLAREGTADRYSGSVSERGHEDDISRSRVEITSPLPDSFGGNVAPESSAQTRPRSTPPQQSQVLGHDEEELEARHAAVRYERSLRPRKPIQEHPYILENAHYSSVLKRHGVKPVRALIEAERERRRREGTLRDDDFRQESQELGPQESAEESQLSELGAFTADLGSLEVPSSSPPRTSPMNHPARPSSPSSSRDDTDGTSVTGQELPDLGGRLSHQTATSRMKKSPQHKGSPPRSAARKRKRHDVVESDAAEPRVTTFTRVPDSPDPLLAPFLSSPPSRNHNLDNGSAQLPATPPRISASPHNSSMSRQVPSTFVIPGDSDSEVELRQSKDRQQDGGSSDSESDAEQSGLELRNTVGRRIRGVLPASWLRLDQKSGPGKLQRDVHRQHRDQSPDREPRRGVAQRRQVLPGSTSNPSIFEDSDDDAGPRPEPTTDDTYHHQTKLMLQPTPGIDVPSSTPSDDGGSVVEDNSIEPMFPGRKRQLKLSESFDGEPKRRKTADNAAGRRRKQPKQPKITSHFNKPRPSTAGTEGPKKRPSKPKHQRRQTNTRQQRPRNAPRRVPAPPRLSILDVIESDAPHFLKIAARTAKRRPNQGRSSPGRKSIRLATRRDHVDAVSVLSDWRLGSIKPRQSVSISRKTPQQTRHAPALAEISGNGSASATDAPRPPVGTSRKLVKQVSESGTARYLAKNTSRASQKNQPPPSYQSAHREQTRSARPAQLEMDGAGQPNTLAFHARKRFLDRLYQKRHGAEAEADSAGGPETTFNDEPKISPLVERQLEPQEDAAAAPRRQPQQRRFRKQTRPWRVDLEAPEYTHADDPLPLRYSAEPEPSPQVPTSGSKIQGLGPYGTHYTHHFEIFPLDSRVYFHDSTLIGGGAIEVAKRSDYYEKLMSSRPRTSYALGDQTLAWGPWNSQVSSELGIILDFVADQLEGSLLEGRPPDSLNVLSAATFVLNYVRNALSFTDREGAKSFVARAHEALQSFDERIAPQTNQLASDRGIRYELVLKIYDRLLLVALLSLGVCQRDPSLMSEQFQVEGLLTSMTKTTISTLLHTGMSEVRKTYEDLNQLRFRERGLRDGKPAIHSWVVAMKVLDLASIPRTSFWDVVQTVLITPQVISGVDARAFERIWENMFTLLPLVEFNSSGLVISGQRHDVVSDGWVLPQKLLRRVFQLYRENTHQPPSFNNYCRALVGRCHYLVQQWGWRRSVTVIGAIFDFFGSQNLEHLRNEEVDKSPHFLEELAGHPVLDIEPEDRCFHVFLKLVALSIRKLRAIGSVNDIRNLVARTMPNHNRQHLKEQKIHERDLEALRNHHNLLATLFWASPPDQRPVAGRIETLVAPASSHKEACLINVRAWNQLARFVVASGEATRSFKPFSLWRNHFFEQMMKQYDSVAADIQQQLKSLPKDDRQAVNPDLINTMISMNKAATMDVLHLSVTASLDVMRYAPDLEAATFALNTPQLQLVFKHFAAAPPELDWAILRVSLATLDSFLSRIEEFKDNEESQPSESQILNSAQADDVLLVMDQNLASSFFSMARCVLSARASRDISATGAMDKATCTEQVIILSARMGMRFIIGGLMQLSDMFKYGKYGLFDGPPHKLSPDHRRYLVLFLSTLLKHGFDDFHDADFTLSEVWTLSLVKPCRYLGYENQLATQLRRLQSEFVPEAVEGLTLIPDYGSNRDLFQFAVLTMRKSINDAGPSLKKILMAEHSKTLKLVMEQIRGDLRSLAHDATEHSSYVAFVRDIISLIRSHGPENCSVDDYFYQMSREYSPSIQDPQLQVASMVSYGLRLSEGDPRAAHQLFYFLFNNFKLSMNGDRLWAEAKMLRKGMKDQGIRGFALGKMIPAAIRASSIDGSALLLLDVYLESLRLYLNGTVVGRQLTEVELPQVVVVLKATTAEFSRMRRSHGPLSNVQVHLVRQLMAFLNLIWPSLHAMSLSRTSGPAWTEVGRYMELFKKLVETADAYVRDLLAMDDIVIQASVLLCGARELDSEQGGFDSHVTSFTDNIVNDVRRNWIFTGHRITIQAPGKARGLPSTQSGLGVEEPRWDADELLGDLHERVKEWRYWWAQVYGAPSPNGCAASAVF